MANGGKPMKNWQRLGWLGLFLLLSTSAALAARDVPVPDRCTPTVNRGLQDLIRSHTRRDVDNIMVCGVATENSRVNRGGRHGSHHIVTLAVQLPDDGEVRVQVVSNDDLEGPVVAHARDQVFAYGQGYIAHGPWAAGIHEVHCATHRGADNGWVVINGNKTPASCPARF
jgi:hypothetical protein